MMQKALFLGLSTFALTACGGGGGDGDGSSSGLSFQELRVQEGFTCNAESCFKSDYDFQYNGTLELCSIASESCETISPYEYARRAIISYVEANQSYEDLSGVDQSSADCSWVESSYYGCTFKGESDETIRIYTDMSPLDFNTLSLTTTTTGAYREFSASYELAEQNNLYESYPSYSITKPSKWLSTFPDLSNLLNSSVVWPDAPIEYRSLRTPICPAESEGWAFSCSFTVNYDEYHQCDYSYISGQQSCNVYSEMQPAASEIIEISLAKIGLDTFTDNGYSFSSSYPVYTLDAQCEPDHVLIKDRLLSLNAISGSGTVQNLDLSDQQDRNLTRWANNADWANLTGNGGHCARVTSIMTMANGSYVNQYAEVVSYPDNSTMQAFFDEVPNGSLVGMSRVPGNNDLATDLFNDTSYFVVWAGGNSQQNYSDDFEGNGYVTSHDYVWDTSLANQMLVVGNLEQNGLLTSLSATPGSNNLVQARWITSFGTDVVTAAPTSLGTEAITLSDGTSFSQPYVTRTLNAGKNICTSSSYPALADVLLATADKDFEAYDASLYGQGRLDAKAFITSLESTCP